MRWGQDCILLADFSIGLREIRLRPRRTGLIRPEFAAFIWGQDYRSGHLNKFSQQLPVAVLLCDRTSCARKQTANGIHAGPLATRVPTRDQHASWSTINR